MRAAIVFVLSEKLGRLCRAVVSKWLLVRMMEALS